MLNYFTSPKIKKAYQFAKMKHAGQLDDTGKDYFTAHLFPVTQCVAQFTDDEATICTALLHDTLEDTETTLMELQANFGWEVAMLVAQVSHSGSKETGYYFPRLEDKRAILVKFADRMSNLSRMETWSEERQEGYLNSSKFWRDKPRIVPTIVPFVEENGEVWLYDLQNKKKISKVSR